MKISNETKVGALAAIAITILILGYNFMKGEDLFTRKNTFYAVYTDVDGLTTSNPVQINGFKIGQVKAVLLTDNSVEHIVVRFEVDRKINVTKSSIARIYNADFFGAKGITLDLDKKGEPALDGDTLVGDMELSVSKSMNTILNPVKAKAEKLLATLDSVLTSVDEVLNDETQTHLRSGFKSLAETLENFKKTSVRVDNIVNDQGKRLDNIFANVESITHNLRENNQVLTKVMKNLNQVTDSLAASHIKTTIANVNQSISDLDHVLKKINNGEGSLGLLINDKKLYENLQSSAKDLDELLIDLKAHPKRYVHFSVFGKSDKADKTKK